MFAAVSSLESEVAVEWKWALAAALAIVIFVLWVGLKWLDAQRQVLDYQRKWLEEEQKAIRAENHIERQVAERLDDYLRRARTAMLFPEQSADVAAAAQRREARADWFDQDRIPEGAPIRTQTWWNEYPSTAAERALRDIDEREMARKFDLVDTGPPESDTSDFSPQEDTTHER